jgi:hypothetical protein
MHRVNATSTGAQWTEASQLERAEFVTLACRNCSTQTVDPSLTASVVEGIDAFFAKPGLRWKKVSVAFGLIYTALMSRGDYIEMLESFAEASGFL